MFKYIFYFFCLTPLAAFAAQTDDSRTMDRIPENSKIVLRHALSLKKCPSKKFKMSGDQPVCMVEKDDSWGFSSACDFTTDADELQGPMISTLTDSGELQVPPGTCNVESVEPTGTDIVSMKLSGCGISFIMCHRSGWTLLSSPIDISTFKSNIASAFSLHTNESEYHSAKTNTSNEGHNYVGNGRGAPGPGIPPGRKAQ